MVSQCRLFLSVGYRQQANTASAKKHDGDDGIGDETERLTRGAVGHAFCWSDVEDAAAVIVFSRLRRQCHLHTRRKRCAR